MKFKSRQELQEMSKPALREYRTHLWLLINAEWATAQREAWRPILRAVERSNENKAALVLRSGAVTRGIVTIQFFEGDTIDDALVRLSVDRCNGTPVEEYAPLPEELMAYLVVLGIDPYRSSAMTRWEAV